MLDIEKYSLAEIHKLLQEGKFSCTELVSDSFERIRKFDNSVKAFLTLNEEGALLEAKEVDKKIANHFELKLLEGIPYSAKDVFCTKGVRTTAGSKMLDEFIPPYDATVIEKVNETGAILIGKTNCDAFGFGGSTENSGYFPTHNPYDLSRVPGGSSGGSAAAVAMGMGVFSIAEDTGGSIRYPSSFCNVSGIKVTYGRVSRYGSIAYGSSLDTVGHMTRGVEDLAVILEITAGTDPHDATTVPKYVPPYSKRLEDPIEGIQIGIPKEYFPLGGINDEVKSKIHEAIKIFEKIGCHIEEINLPHTEYAVPAYYLSAICEASANLARYDGIRFGHSVKNAKILEELYTRNRAEGFEDEVKRRIMLGTYALSSGYFEAYYKKAMQMRTVLKRDFDDAFGSVDIILTPVSPNLPFKIGAHEGDPLAMWLEDVFTNALNPTGCPGLAIPAGFSGSNLPIGMQLIGPQFSEELLFRLGYHFQEETNFHKVVPKLLSEGES